MIKSIITEYGLLWIVNRLLYSLKLKMMRFLPVTELLFEKRVCIKRINIFDVDVKRIEKFLKELPTNNKNEIIQIADKAIDGRIKAFSSIELDYGTPINWHINPITNVEVNKKTKWYNIPDFDSDRGDIKIVWEASRFTHFFYFARAYMITKDAKYYSAYSNQLRNWLKENSYSYGANYKCGQEATLRMINALIVYSVFKEYGLTNELDEYNLKELVKVSYKKVLSNFFYAHKCIKNNHTLSEITGLIIGAWCSDDKVALERAYQLLNKEINDQFLKDGGYIQFSFNYQRFSLQIMEFILKISAKTEVYPSENSLNLIKKSAILMYQLQDETGDVPNYGSNDGALIFPLTSCDYRDFRPVLNTIYALIKGERLYKTGIYDEEALWFLNKDIQGLPIAKILRETVAFKETGLYSFRHKDGFLMIILNNLKTRPSQMDQMHIDLWYKGVNILCDSGTFSYASDLGNKLALSGAHNTVKVDDKEQMKKLGHFLIYNWSYAQDIVFNESYFTGTMVSKNGYAHTRSIKKYNDGYVIEDRVVGNYKDLQIFLHTPCEIEEKEYGLDFIHEERLIAKMYTSSIIKLNKSYRSLYYLKKEEINQIIIIAREENNIKFKIQLVDQMKEERK